MWLFVRFHQFIMRLFMFFYSLQRHHHDKDAGLRLIHGFQRRKRAPQMAIQW